MIRLRTQYAAAVDSRNLTGIQLIDRSRAWMTSCVMCIVKLVLTFILASFQTHSFCISVHFCSVVSRSMLGYTSKSLLLARQHTRSRVQPNSDTHSHTHTRPCRNDELCILYEKANIQEKILKDGGLFCFVSSVLLV